MNLLKIFKRSKVNYSKSRYHQQLPTELDTALVNNSLTPYGHRAIKEIRVALIMLGTLKCSNLDPDYVPSTADDFSDELKAVWSRYRLWLTMTENKKKERDAVIAFAKGKRPREIEQEIRVRNGRGKSLIKDGTKIYAEIIKHENRRLK